MSGAVRARRPAPAIGLDLGRRRIGVAVSDAAGVLASPRLVLERSGDRATDHRTLSALVADEGADVVVVGLPRSLDGSEGPAARATRDEVAELASRLPVPVEFHDERFSTVEAHRRLAEQGLDARAQRKVVDRAAAAIMLQAWLDRWAADRAGDPAP